MTKNEFVLTYTYGLDGNEPVPFDKFVALLEHLATRGMGATRVMQANTVGLATIGTGDGYVIITPKNDANDIVHLPAVASIEKGHTVAGVCTATGCEVRVAVADDDVVSLNNNHVTVNEAAIAASMSFVAKYVDTNLWIINCYSIAGAVTAPTPD